MEYWSTGVMELWDGEDTIKAQSGVRPRNKGSEPKGQGFHTEMKGDYRGTEGCFPAANLMIQGGQDHRKCRPRTPLAGYPDVSAVILDETVTN